MELCNEGDTFFISFLVGTTCQGLGLCDVGRAVYFFIE